jgi:hypothetical protein
VTRTGFRSLIGFNGLLWIVTTGKYKSFTDTHYLQITTTNIKTYIFTRRYYATASKNGYTSAYTLAPWLGYNLLSSHSSHDCPLTGRHSLSEADLTAKLLLVLASTVILGFESHGNNEHILLSDGSGSRQTNSSGQVSACSAFTLPFQLDSSVGHKAYISCN